MKRKLFGASCCALALLLAAGCGPSGGEAGGAGDTSPAFVAAADALAAKLATSGADGKVPAPADPAVQGFEAETGKALGTLGTPALPIRGFDSYAQLCGKTVEIVSAYVNAGVERLPEAARAEAMNRNIEQHMDQVFTPLIFSAHCTAAHLPFIEETVGSSDLGDKADALKQVRDGAYGQVHGLLEMAGAADLDAGRRRRIVDLLAADAGNFAIILSRQQRQELGTMAERVAGLPEDARAQASKIRAGLAQASCHRLCNM
jgi:hypothetical protein